MIQQLAEILAQRIRTANLVTVAGGLASAWKANTKDRNTKAVYWNYQAQEHQLLVPDADKAAITYFEELGPARITNKATGMYRADLALIGWVNTATDAGIETPLLITQLQALFKGMLASGVYQHIRVEFTELLPENEQLFAKYNYDTAVRKYLQKPYDAFGLRMIVTFNVLPC